MQYLDISQDPNFGAGSFQGAGPLSASAGTYKWPGLKANVYYYYRVNERGPDNQWHTSSYKSVAQNCGGGQLAAANADYRKDIYGSNDRFVIASQGINAPVNVRDVGPDGQLGDPTGKDDVVRYDFKLFPGMGGYPGSGGTTVVAGHVDYHPNFEAVFWNLRYVRPGDLVEYYRGDGKKQTYKIDWAQQVDTSTDWNSMMVATNPESLLIITCDGVFNSATHEYSNRFAAHAIAVAG
jgi:LPXTG-site transpeptidase (sortase) family protein